MISCQRKEKINKCDGLAFMPTVLMIGIIMVELGIAMAFVIYLSNLSVLGTRLAQEAWFAARTGINDAMLRISRDKTFPTGFSGYEMTLGRANVSVSVEKNTPLTNQDTITSAAAVRNRQKKIQAIINIDSRTDQVSLVSMEEI